MDTLETETISGSEHGGNRERIVRSYGIPTEDIHDFSVNTNPLGTPEIAEEILRESAREIDRYPSPSPEKACEALSHWHEIQRENVTAGNGSIELIYAAARLFPSPKALLLSPTFTEYERAVHAADGAVTHWISGEEENFQHDFTAPVPVNYHDSEIIFVCHPNNPTGILSPRWMLKDWIKKFLPFVSEGEKCSLIPLALEEERVLVLRSLTKILAVPGLRLGYAVGHSQTISQLEKILPPWRINIGAQRLAERISEFDDYIQDTRGSLPLFYKDFINNFNNLHSVHIFPSSCNFVLAKVVCRESTSFRPSPSFPLLPPSFPRKRESRKDISGLDSRFRGNDDGDGNDGMGGNDVDSRQTT
ncbi:MAG: aminotransferase class I/II-fold pyridoxal phosphate-dependent enzyme, partial [Elusimicrobia bacterium]|nr:aminotransferase class I/II-fold pyridoxal phosphate-dependent enzyme [Elusimicrobiota bacterium]